MRINFFRQFVEIDPAFHLLFVLAFQFGLLIHQLGETAVLTGGGFDLRLFLCDFLFQIGDDFIDRVVFPLLLIGEL